jgi:hypothetical protein
MKNEAIKIVTVVDDTSLKIGEHYYNHEYLWGKGVIRGYIDPAPFHVSIDMQGYDERNSNWLYTQTIYDSWCEGMGLFKKHIYNILFSEYRIKVEIKKTGQTDEVFMKRLKIVVV